MELDCNPRLEAITLSTQHLQNLSARSKNIPIPAKKRLARNSTGTKRVGPRKAIRKENYNKDSLANVTLAINKIKIKKKKKILVEIEKILETFNQNEILMQSPESNLMYDFEL